jgi:hypothetical protein
VLGQVVAILIFVGWLLGLAGISGSVYLVGAACIARAIEEVAKAPYRQMRL